MYMIWVCTVADFNDLKTQPYSYGLNMVIEGEADDYPMP